MKYAKTPITLACLALAFALWGVNSVIPAKASALRSLSVEASRPVISSESDYAVQFVTTSGVDSAEDTIIIDFEQGFDLSKLALENIKLSLDDNSACDGPFVEKSLAALQTSEAWGVSMSGQSIEFLPPIDQSMPEIGQNSCVLIRIGGNSSDGSEGKIVNPSAVGAYTITVHGSFGDLGLASVGILEENQVTFYATADPAGSLAKQEDKTAPLILSPSVSDVTETTALIKWNTDEVATSVAKWNESRADRQGVESDNNLKYNHSLELEGLDPGKTYIVTISSFDHVGNGTVQQMTFATADYNGPRLITPQITDVSAHFAQIAWATDENSNGTLLYGRSSLYELGYVSESDFTTDHIIALHGLEAGTTYQVQARSMDKTGNISFSEPLFFTTFLDLPPSNVNLSLTESSGSANLSWDLPTDEDLAGVQIVYRNDRYPTNAFDGEIVYNQMGSNVSVALDKRETAHYFAAFAYDAFGNIASGSLAAIGSAEKPAKEREKGITVKNEVRQDNISFLAVNGLISLSPIDENIYQLLAEKPFLVALDLSALDREVTLATVEIDGRKYLLNDITAYEAKDKQLSESKTQRIYGHIAPIIAPGYGDYSLKITVNYSDGDVAAFNYMLEIVPLGFAFESVEGEMELLEGTKTELFVQKDNRWVSWEGTNYFQANPMITNASGRLGWYVPNGIYDLRAQKAGYLEKRTGRLSVANNIVNPAIELDSIPPSFSEIIAGDADLSEKLGQIQLRLRLAREQLQQSTFAEYVAHNLLILFVSAVLIALIIAFWTKGRLKRKKKR